MEGGERAPKRGMTPEHARAGSGWLMAVASWTTDRRERRVGRGRRCRGGRGAVGAGRTEVGARSQTGRRGLWSARDLAARRLRGSDPRYDQAAEGAVRTSAGRGGPTRPPWRSGSRGDRPQGPDVHGPRAERRWPRSPAAAGLAWVPHLNAARRWRRPWVLRHWQPTPRAQPVVDRRHLATYAEHGQPLLGSSRHGHQPRGRTWELGPKQKTWGCSSPPGPVLARTCCL